MNQGIAGDIAAIMPAVLESGLMISLCTITKPPQVFGDSGAPDPTAPYVPVVIGGGLSLADLTDEQLAALTNEQLLVLQNSSGSSGISLVDIPCMAAGIGGRVQPTEMKEMKEILARNTLHILLGGYYPQIIADYRAVVDGVVYDIVGTVSDSQSQMTTLAVTLVSL